MVPGLVRGDIDPGARAGPELVQPGCVCTYVKEKVVASPLLLWRRFLMAAARDLCGAQAAQGVSEIPTHPAATHLPSLSRAGGQLLCQDVLQPPHQVRLQVHSSWNSPVSPRGPSTD